MLIFCGTIRTDTLGCCCCQLPRDLKQKALLKLDRHLRSREMTSHGPWPICSWEQVKAIEAGNLTNRCLNLWRKHHSCRRPRPPPPPWRRTCARFDERGRRGTGRGKELCGWPVKYLAWMRYFFSSFILWWPKKTFPLVQGIIHRVQEMRWLLVRIECKGFCLMFAFITMCFFYISPLLSGGFAGQVDQSMCSCSSQDDTARVLVQNSFVEVA